MAPVGMAWADVRRQQPSRELFFTDGSHPSEGGSCLAACTLFAAVFTQSPVGLPGTIGGVPVNLETAAPEPARSAVLVDLRPDVALALQNAAWRAWEQTGTLALVDVRPVTPPTVGPLPAGMPLIPGQVAGTWRGSFALYPSFRTDMVLRLDHQASGWSAHLELKYNTSDAQDQSFVLDDLQVEAREITFTNPKAWQGLVMHFRGVSVPGGSLRGVVEATQPNSDNPARLVGSWELRRQG